MKSTRLSLIGLSIIVGSIVGACADSAVENAPVVGIPVAATDGSPDGDTRYVPDSVFVGPDSVVILEVITTPSSIGEVAFPHYEHVDDFGMECAECHHEVNATALDTPHESYFEDFWVDCETCHSNDSEPTSGAMSCATCHHDKPVGLSDQRLSSKVAIHQNCWDCHEVGRGADASSECAFCHSGPKEPGFAPRK